MAKNILFILFTVSLILCCNNRKDKNLVNSLLITNDSILNKKFYPSGELNFIIYSKDSIILDSREKCTKLYIEYYKNGFIKEKGCQGIFDAKETPVGTGYEYDSLQRLIKTTYFHPDKFGKDYKIVKDYNELGEIISDKIFRNDELYEIDMIELKKSQNNKVCVQEFKVTKAGKNVFYTTAKNTKYTLNSFVYPQEYEEDLDLLEKDGYKYKEGGYKIEEALSTR